MPVTEQQQLLGSQDSPILGIALLAAAIWVSKIWWDDYKLKKAGKPHPGALPGTTPCTAKALWIAAIGGMVLIFLETLLEWNFGYHTQQTVIAAWFLAPMFAAAVLEEVIFRGYLTIQKQGQTILLASCIGFSALFAIAHPHLWTWEENSLTLHLDSGKAWFTTIALFVKSMWFYYLRFAPFNAQHSLLPCIAAHLAVNVATFLIKAQQGYVQW